MANVYGFVYRGNEVELTTAESENDRMVVVLERNGSLAYVEHENLESEWVEVRDLKAVR